MSFIIFLMFTGFFDRIEAVSGDEIFLKSELDELSIFYGGQEATRSLIRNELVNRAIVVKKAEQETIMVRDEEVSPMLDSYIEQLKEQYGGEEGLAKECEERGISIVELRNRYLNELKSQFMLRKYLEKKSRSYLIVTPTEVKQFYDQNKDSIAFRPGTVVLKHILISIKPSQEEIEKASHRVSEIYDLLMRGGEFSVLAREFSDDPNSKYRGGSLGRIRKGETVKEFEYVVFQLKPGEISPPFQTRFGIHIAEVLSKDEESVIVRQILIAVKPTKRDTQLAYNKAEKIIDNLNQGTDFDSLALLYSEDPLAQEGSSLLGEFIEEQIPPVFADKILQLDEGDVSEPILTPFGYHVLKIVKRTKQKILSYEEMRPRIENYLREEKFKLQYEKWSEKLKKEVFSIVIDED